MSKINIPVIIRVKNALLEWIDFFFILIFGKLSLMFITEKTEIQKKFQTQSKNIKQFVKNFAHILKCIYWNQKNVFFIFSWKTAENLYDSLKPRCTVLSNK